MAPANPSTSWSLRPAAARASSSGITGPASTCKHHGRLFERFARFAPARHYGGFGLGLWIARVIVEAHGGTIGVESQVGQGATFFVDLPLTTAPPSAS